MVPWTRPTHHPKLRLDPVSHFSAEFTYIATNGQTDRRSCRLWVTRTWRSELCCWAPRWRWWSTERGSDGRWTLFCLCCLTSWQSAVDAWRWTARTWATGRSQSPRIPDLSACHLPIDIHGLHKRRYKSIGPRKFE